jgi:hypothetical protein
MTRGDRRTIVDDVLRAEGLMAAVTRGTSNVSSISPTWPMVDRFQIPGNRWINVSARRRTSNGSGDPGATEAMVYLCETLSSFNTVRLLTFTQRQ